MTKSSFRYGYDVRTNYRGTGSAFRGGAQGTSVNDRTALGKGSAGIPLVFDRRRRVRVALRALAVVNHARQGIGHTQCGDHLPPAERAEYIWFLAFWEASGRRRLLEVACLGCPVRRLRLHLALESPWRGNELRLLRPPGSQPLVRDGFGLGVCRGVDRIPAPVAARREVFLLHSDRCAWAASW